MTQENTPQEQALQVRPKDLILAQPEVALAEWVTSLVVKYHSLKVTDSASEVEATAAYAEIHGYLKQIEAEKLLVTKPARNWVQDINNRVLNLTTSLKELADNILRNELQPYRDKVRAAAAKEQARLQKLADNRAARAEEAGRPAPLPEAVAPLVSGPAKSLETDMGSSSFITRWKAERIPGQEALIPHEYFTTEDVYKVVDVQVNAVVRATKGAVKIPGYRIFSEETLSTRGRGV